MKKGGLPKEPYCFVAPDGEIHQGEGIRTFARKMGLDAANLQHVHLGERQHHKGWKAQEQNDD